MARRLLGLSKMQKAPSAMVCDTSRLPALDLARAIAVYGMMMINFKLIFHHDTGYFPLLTNLAAHLDGRAAATFVVLAGIGVDRFSRKQTAAVSAGRKWRAVSALTKRSVFLLVAGGLFTLTWPCDILHIYAILLAAGAWISRLSIRAVLTIFLLMWCIFLGFMSTFDYDLLWKNTGMSLWQMKSLSIIAKHYFFHGTYPLIPWLIFFIAGIGIGKRLFVVLKRSRRLILFGLITAGLAESAACLLIKFNAAGYFSAGANSAAILNDTITNPALNWFVVRPFPPTPLFVVSGLGTAMVVIGCAQWAVSLRTTSPFIRALVNTGRISMTIYVGHIVLGINIMEWFGIDGDQHIVFVVEWASLAFLCWMLFAQYLHRHSRKGPLEWLMRKTSEISIASFRRPSAEATPLKPVPVIVPFQGGNS